MLQASQIPEKQIQYYYVFEEMEVLLNDFKNPTVEKYPNQMWLCVSYLCTSYSPSSLYIYANTLLSIFPMYSH